MAEIIDRKEYPSFRRCIYCEAKDVRLPCLDGSSRQWLKFALQLGLTTKLGIQLYYLRPDAPAERRNEIALSY
jgi:hypothetical protein